VVTDAKMARMMKHVGLGGGLANARERGLVENAEEEEMFLSLELEVGAILASGGSIADVGFADWTED